MVKNISRVGEYGNLVVVFTKYDITNGKMWSPNLLTKTTDGKFNPGAWVNVKEIKF